MTFIYKIICFTCTTLYFSIYIHYNQIAFHQKFIFHSLPHGWSSLSFHPPTHSSSFLSGDHYSILCIYVLSFSLVGSFILVLFVCYIPHLSEIVWYLSFSIWLIWKRLFKCHLRRQSEKTAKCLPIAYPSKVSWWHVPELICMWIRRIVELFLLTSTPCTLVYHCESGKRWEKVWWAKNSQEKRHSYSR